MAISNWGYLIKEKKTPINREKTILEARRAYREGINNAWSIYTEDNIIVKSAKEALNSAIDKAYKSCRLSMEKECQTKSINTQIDSLSKLSSRCTANLQMQLSKLGRPS